MNADAKIIDGPRYVVVIDRLNDRIYRVRKPRVGLMRFGNPPVYGVASPVERTEGER